MKPWIFWTGKVPNLDFPGEMVAVRIVVVEPQKYVLEVEMCKSVLGEVGWMDAFDIGNVDIAKVFEVCVLSLIARRNALGWIPRSEISAEPEEDEPPAQIQAPLDDNNEDEDDPDERTITRLGQQAYRQRCSEKWTHAGVVNELQRNTARGRILRAFTQLGQSLRGNEIAKSAGCSTTTVSNYCADYEAAGWIKNGPDGWSLVRALPKVEPAAIEREPAWTKRRDLHPDLNAEDRRELESGRSNLRPEPKPAEKVNSTNGHTPVNSSAPLIDRVVDALSRGPHKFDRLAGLLVVGIQPLTSVLADLMSDGTVMMKDGKYQLDENA